MMKTPNPPLSSFRIVLLLWAPLMLGGCQHLPSDRLEQRLAQIQDQRLASLGHEDELLDSNTQPWPSGHGPNTLRSEPPRPASRQQAWVQTGSPQAATRRDVTPSDIERRSFALAAFQDELDSGAAQSQAAAEKPRTARGPLPGFLETVKRDIKRWPSELWRDTVNVYTDPVNVIILLGASGATIALRQHTDEHNAEFFEDENHFGQGWRDALSFVGSPATHFVLGGLWYAAGIVKQDEKTYEVGRTLIDALAITGATTLAIKYASGRDSPNGEEYAFPSGHTSSTVTFAAVMHNAYGPWVGIPLYGLSALVGIERLDDQEHWLSDVVFGAALGLVVGHTVADGRRPEIFGGELAPYISPDTGVSGIAWVKTFD